MTHFRPASQHRAALLALSLSALAQTAWAEVPRIVSDNPVSGSLVQAVMGDLGSPVVLLPSGADAHDYQLRPSQAGAVADADLLIWIGPELSPWMSRAQGSLAKGGNSLELLHAPGTHLLPFAEGEGEDDHDHAGGHDHDHDHGAINPHAWLDPDNGKLWLNAIAEALSAEDPDHAADYAKNAATAAAGIDAVAEDLRVKLVPAQGKTFIVLHDAYGYFTEHFGLEPAVAISAGDATTPSAARLRKIKEEVTASKALCAFPEQNHDARLVAAVTEGSAVTAGPALDPEGSALPPGARLYPDLLRGLGDSIAACLSK